MKTSLAMLVCLIGTTWAPIAEAADVTVTITGIRDSRGVIRVAVCPRADFLHPRCPYVAKAAANVGSVVVMILDVPPGVYAAQAYQDANDNGLLDRTWLGFPEEGMGFSNDAPIRFGPPAFDKAAIRIGPENAMISFRLRYFSSH